MFASLMSSDSRRSLSKAALVAAFLAATGNSLLYLIYYVTGIIPWSMLSPGRGVSITPRLVFLVSIGGALGGTLLYAIIRRSASDPVRMFKLVAGVVLILSFIAPFLIDTFTPGLILALDLMHVVVFAATVWALTVWMRPDKIRPSV
jgi:hypothetical protein